MSLVLIRLKGRSGEQSLWVCSVGGIRNYLFASIVVEVGSLWAMTAIYS
jgi:hypothetical protein